MKQKRTQRVQFDFHPKAIARLDELVDETGATSRAEVVRRALALYDQFLTAEKSGKRAVFREEDGSEQAILIV